MLSNIKDRGFDDLLYYILFNKKNIKCFDSLKIDDEFLENVYNFYLLVEEEKLLFISSKEKSGYSTGMAFLIAFYSVNVSDITVITLPDANYRNRMLELMKGFFYTLQSDVVVESLMDNKEMYILVTSPDGVNCKIKFHSSGSYKSIDLKGLIFFDHAGLLRKENINKLDGLIETFEEDRKVHDRIVLNFSSNEVYDNLVTTNSKKIKLIKFYNG